MEPSYHWTEAEIRTLREDNAMGVSRGHTAFKLCRTIAAVHRKARELKLRLPNPKLDQRKTRNAWSRHDDKLLMELWTMGVMSRMIAAKLGRSVQAISCRAKKLGENYGWCQD